MNKTTFIVNGVDVLEENAKLKKENEILQTSLEMIKNTEGQAHIKAIELTKKLDKIKEKINAHCAVCETIRRPKCDDCILSWLLEIIEGAKMSKIVDRDTFLYYLDNGDVNWEATARECIAKGFELAEENKKLKEEIKTIKEETILKLRKNCLKCEYKNAKQENEKLKEKLEKIKEAITTCLTFHTCQKCKFYKECEMSLEEFILEVIYEVLKDE